MKYVQNLLYGLALGGMALGNQTAYRSPENGFMQDRNALRGDLNKVITQFNHNVKQEYGKQKQAS